MRRTARLAIILASLMLMTIKCSGGVNPGQARDTHQAIAAQLTAATVRAAPRQPCLGVILKPSMWTAGNPHSPNDIIHGKVIMEGGPCPPRDGYLTLQLQKRIRQGLWRVLASDGPERVPHLSGQKIECWQPGPCTALASLTGPARGARQMRIDG